MRNSYTTPVPGRLRFSIAALLALAVGSTACTDQHPLEPPTNAAGLEPTLSVVLSPGVSFTASLNAASPMLEVFGPQPPSYSSGGAVFAYPTDDGRTYLRTIGAYPGDFVAEVTVTVSGSLGYGAAFFGFGRGDTGDAGCAFWCEPVGRPTIYARVHPNDFGGGGTRVVVHTTGGITELTGTGPGGAGGSGTHRLRMTWTAATRQLTFAIDRDYVVGQPFVADATLGPYVPLEGVFDATNARIFFGGANNAAFRDLVVTGPYAFTGFFSPVVNPPAWNGMNAGRNVPMKWSLGGDEGMDILAPGSPTSRRVHCSTGRPIGAEAPALAPGGSGLTYNVGTDQYQFNWKTEKSWEHTCREFVLRLTDGSVRTARFEFDDAVDDATWYLGAVEQSVVMIPPNGFGFDRSEVRCPEGSVAVGYEGRGGHFIEQVRLRCAPLLLDGTLGAWSATADRVGFGEGGAPSAGMCPMIDGVQTVMVRDNGMRGGDVHHIRGYCRLLTEVLNGATNADAPHITTDGIGGQHADSQHYNVACPNGYVVTGIFGGVQGGFGILRSVGYFCRQVLLG